MQSMMQQSNASFPDALALMAEFVEILPDNSTAIDNAYQVRDRKEVCAQCHRLDGALCFVHAPRLKAALSIFHQHIREHGFTNAAEQFYQQFNDEADRLVQTFLQDYSQK